MMDCPERSLLYCLLAGELSKEHHVEVEGHVAGCRHCQAILDEFTNRPTCDIAPLDEIPPALQTRAGETTAEKRPAVGSSTQNAMDLPGYRILGQIGRGGMGVVYRAYQASLKRVVALKMIRDIRLAGETERGRFRAEAEAAARLRHPGVVQIFEVGEHLGEPFMALEFVEGQSLAARLRRGPLAPREAAGMLVLMAEAIQHAHANGVIHRDLKPGNVLLDAAGEPKVLDFGLAKLADTDDQLTQTGVIMGTPEYMAPEQARGESKQAGPMADIWALGVILYECLAARPPFRAANTLETLAQVLDADPVPLRQLAPRTPGDLEVICMKCLRKQPENRYASAQELADDLRRFLADEPILARPIGRAELAVKWVRRHPTWTALMVVSLLAVVVASVGAVQYQRRLEDNRSRLLVDSLRTATTSELLRIRSDLLARRRYTEPAVRDLLERSRAEGDARAELNAALVMAQWEPGELDFVLDRLLAALPEDLVNCREMLEPRAEAVRERLGPIVADRLASRARRLRAQALVAEEGASVPPDLADEVAGQMLVEDRLQLAAWVRALAPIRRSLVEPLMRRYARSNDDESGLGTALILREYLKGDTVRVVPLLARGGLRQAYLVSASLRDAPDAEKRLVEEFDRFAPVFLAELDLLNEDECLDADAQRRTKFGVALLAAGHQVPVFRACVASDDPRLRTYLIHAFAKAGVDPQMLSSALTQDTEPAVRQAVYLAWGEYSIDRWSQAELDAVLRQVTEDFENHPDPGVHSAAESLLRRWAPARLKTLTARLPGEQSRGNRRWFVNSQGTAFALVSGPKETVLGSWNWEWSSDVRPPHYGSEVAHRRRIGRSFAVATTEVTFEQLARFFDDCRDYLPKTREFGRTRSSRSGDSPVIYCSWYEAAMVCRWLSEKEGVPEYQMCYPSVKVIAEARDQNKDLPLPKDHLQRTGYRLPTEAEWEYTCRTGSATPFSFGSDQALLPSHARFEDRKSGFHSQPVGGLMPNRFGMFDMHGNASEWCDILAFGYPAVSSIRMVYDEGAHDIPLRPKDMCVLRGGEFSNAPERLRAAHRTVVTRDNCWPGSGMRLARTIATPALDVFRIDCDGTMARFGVRGAPGQFRVTSVTGDVACHQTDASIPGTFQVVNAGSGMREYSFVVERLDSGDKVPISELFLPVEWNYRWYTYEPPSIVPYVCPTPAAWSKAISGKPIEEGKTSKSTFTQAPGNGYRGMVATAEIDIPSGHYEISVNSRSPFRSYLNGEWLLGYNWRGHVNRQVIVRHLAKGKHSLRFECIAGDFDFQIRKAPGVPRPAPAPQVLPARPCVQSEATFDLTGEGSYKIEELSKDILVTPAEGKAPTTLRVTGVDLHTRPFGFIVRRTTGESETSHLVRVWGTLAPGQLNIQPMRTNAIGMRVSLIPAGEFQRGSPQRLIDLLSRRHSEAHRRAVVASEGPRHRVQLTRPFGLGIHEVTVGQFRAFVQETKFVTQAEREGGDVLTFFDGNWLPLKKGYRWRDSSNARSEAHPVVQMTWNDARAFCDWMSKKDGIRCRLPTEAEWEYATRAGTSTTWFFGDASEPLDEFAWYRNNSDKRTQPVGRKKPNPWGLHDVYGNVNEWCEDAFDTETYARQEARDPKGAAQSKGWSVVRGGHIAEAAEECRSAWRHKDQADRSANLLGFRIASAPWTPSQQVRLKQVRHLPAHEYQVTDVEVTPEVTVASGDVSAAVTRYGPVAFIRAVARGENNATYSLVIRVLGQPKQVVTGMLLRTDWEVTFHARIDPSRRDALLAATVLGGATSPFGVLAAERVLSVVEDAELGYRGPPTTQEWERMLGTPLLRGRVPHLDFNWESASPGPDVPNHYFGMVATTDLELSEESAGEYRLAGAVDDGLRVYLDDTLVLDAWAEGDIHTAAETVHLKAGKHRLRAEYFNAVGRAEIHLRLSRLGPSEKRPPSTAPERRAAEWVLSMGGTVRVNVQGNDLKSVSELPREPFRLTYFNLYANERVRDADLARFANCKNLTELHLSNTPVTDTGLIHFAACKDLVQIGLGNVKVSDVGLASFEGCKNLRHLYLFGTQVTDAGMAYLKGCKGLGTLHLSDTRVSDLGLEHFHDCENLNQLYLYNIGLTDAGLAHFENRKHLHVLRLSNTKVTDAGLARFRGSRDLRLLHLSDTKVGDAGLAHFRGCKELGHLELDNTVVTDAGVAIIRGFSKLVILRVKGTKVSPAKLRELASALPACRIEHDGGIIEPAK